MVQIIVETIKRMTKGTVQDFKCTQILRKILSSGVSDVKTKQTSFKESRLEESVDSLLLGGLCEY